MATLASLLPPSFMPPAADPNATSQGPAFAAPMAAKPPMAPQQGGGLLGALSNMFGPKSGGRNWQIIGAALRQLDTGGNDLDSLLARLDQERQQQMQMAWQQTLQQHQLGEWKAEDQQQQAAQDFVTSLPADQQPLARVNPGAIAAARIQAMAPPTQYQQAELGLSRDRLAEDARHNRVSEARPVGGMGTSGPIDPETVGYYAQLSVNQGGRLPQGISTRSALGQAIMAAMPAEARRQGVNPQQLATVSLAYQGDTHSYQHLQQQRDAVVAFERTADNFLTNLQNLQRQLPSGQISNIPAGNDALQAYNRTLGGRGPLGAYVGALVSARAEISRVLSGSNSPTVESMHEAERLLPNNITPQAMSAVAANIHNEMRLRSGALDSTLSDIRDRRQSGELPPSMLDESNTSTVGGAQRPPGVPLNFVRDPQTGRWRAP